MTNTAHTPTPWIILDSTNFLSNEKTIASTKTDTFGANISICEIPDYAPDVANPHNAAFIVRACNSHDEKNKILNSVLSVLADMEPVIWDSCSNYAKTGVSNSLDEALEKYRLPLMFIQKKITEHLESEK